MRVLNLNILGSITQGDDTSKRQETSCQNAAEIIRNHFCLTLDRYRHHWASLDTMTCVQVTMLQAPPAQPQGPPAQAPPAQAPPAQAPPPQQAPPPVPLPQMQMARPQVRNRFESSEVCIRSMSGKHLEPAQAILYSVYHSSIHIYYTHIAYYYIHAACTYTVYILIHHISNIHQYKITIEYTVLAYSSSYYYGILYCCTLCFHDMSSDGSLFVPRFVISCTKSEFTYSC